MQTELSHLVCKSFDHQYDIKTNMGNYEWFSGWLYMFSEGPYEQSVIFLLHIALVQRNCTICQHRFPSCLSENGKKKAASDSIPNK
jgi:hypothetical protein